MKPLTPEERKELKRLTRRIQTQRATVRELHRAFSLINRDHAEARIAAEKETTN